MVTGKIQQEKQMVQFMFKKFKDRRSDPVFIEFQSMSDFDEFIKKIELIVRFEW